MAIDTGSNTAFIEQQIYSDLVLRNLETPMLPDMFWRNVTDFAAGGTLNIPTVGSVTLQDVTENEDITFNPIDTNRVTLAITEHKGDGFYITDEMREDGYNVDALLSARADEGALAMRSYFQTTAFQALYDAQTASDPNTINGQAHRRLATGGNEELENADLLAMKLAFDKADVPQQGRVAVVDPVVENTLLRSYQGSYNVDSNPTLQAILESGLDNNMKFSMNLFGWDIFVSNLLPDVASGVDVDGTNSTSGASKANLFLSVMSDNITPLMGAWRRQPTTETFRGKQNRDEFKTTARWGWGAQRVDTLGVIVTSATATA